jgi:hypothetical protein
MPVPSIAVGDVGVAVRGPHAGHFVVVSQPFSLSDPDLMYEVLLFAPERYHLAYDWDVVYAVGVLAPHEVEWAPPELRSGVEWVVFGDRRSGSPYVASMGLEQATEWVRGKWFGTPFARGGAVVNAVQVRTESRPALSAEATVILETAEGLLREWVPRIVDSPSEWKTATGRISHALSAMTMREERDLCRFPVISIATWFSSVAGALLNSFVEDTEARHDVLAFVRWLNGGEPWVDSTWSEGLVRAVRGATES